VTMPRSFRSPRSAGRWSRAASCRRLDRLDRHAALVAVVEVLLPRLPVLGIGGERLCLLCMALACFSLSRPKRARPRWARAAAAAVAAACRPPPVPRSTTSSRPALWVSSIRSSPEENVVGGWLGQTYTATWILDTNAGKPRPGFYDGKFPAR
jgi:hypothetical protein